MALSAEELATTLGGTAGAVPPTDVLYVVAVPRFDPGTTSLRAALVVAAADELRRPGELPPHVLSPLVTGTVVDGTIQAIDPAALDLAGRRVVQLVATASQTAPVVVEQLARLRAAGVPLEVVASTAEIDASLAAAGVARGVARGPKDAQLEVVTLAADRPDLTAWRKAMAVRGAYDHTPVVLIERAGTPFQRAGRTTLRRIDDEPVLGPVVLVVGDDVVGPVPWRDRLPLAGLVVANLRATHQAHALSARLRDLGAAVVPLPLLDIEEGDADGMATGVHRCAAGDVDLLCLTSPNGVRALAEAVSAAGLDVRALAPVGRMACVGPGTAAVLRRLLAIDADLVAPVHTTVGLAEAVGAAPDAGASAWLPRADLATPALADALVASGWSVTATDAYRTVPRELTEDQVAGLAAGAVDLVPVLSSSMAEALVAVGRESGVRSAIVSIGPVTSATLREHGVEPITEADPHDLDGLVEAVVRGAGALRG